MHKEGRISKEHCHKILKDTLSIISKFVLVTTEKESNLLSLQDPVTVVGDLHG